MPEEPIKYYFSGIVLWLGAITLFLLFVFFVFMIMLFWSMIGWCFLIFATFWLLFGPAYGRCICRIGFLIKDIPALIIGPDTLEDNINGQVFQWSDIKSIKEYSPLFARQENRSITISLAYPTDYLNGKKNAYKRLGWRLREKYFGGAFEIPPNAIKGKKSDILRDLNKYLLNSKTPSWKTAYPGSSSAHF